MCCEPLSQRFVMTHAHEREGGTYGTTQYHHNQPGPDAVGFHGTYGQSRLPHAVSGPVRQRGGRLLFPCLLPEPGLRPQPLQLLHRPLSPHHGAPHHGLPPAGGGDLPLKRAERQRLPRLGQRPQRPGGRRIRRPGRIPRLGDVLRRQLPPGAGPRKECRCTGAGDEGLLLLLHRTARPG